VCGVVCGSHGSPPGDLLFTHPSARLREYRRDPPAIDTAAAHVLNHEGVWPRRCAGALQSPQVLADHRSELWVICTSRIPVSVFESTI
jgi:hypothetical protein